MIGTWSDVPQSRVRPLARREQSRGPSHRSASSKCRNRSCTSSGESDHRCVRSNQPVLRHTTTPERLHETNAFHPAGAYGADIRSSERTALSAADIAANAKHHWRQHDVHRLGAGTARLQGERLSERIIADASGSDTCG